MELLNSPGSAFQFGSDENYYWFSSGFDNPFFNQVTIYDRDDEVFERAIKKFYDANTVHSVFLGGAGLHHAQTLQARGYTMRGATPLMAYALDPEIDQHVLREGLEVRRVESRDDLEIAQELLATGFGLSMEIVTAYTEALFGNPDSFRYILLDQSIPVSTTNFVRTDKFLGCFDVATPSEHQRKNYGDELMRWAFAEHAVSGDELVVLQASLAGQPLYRKRGFQFLEYVQSWYMEDTNRMRRFTHHHLQLGEYKLRPLVEADRDTMIPYLNDPEVHKWMQIPNPFEEKDLHDQLKKWKERLAGGHGINWVIELAGVPQGTIACHHTDWELKRTEIGYMAFPPSRGKGLIPNVLRLLTEFLFDEYGFERVEVLTDIRNLPSQRAALKAGFTFEGQLRRNYLNKGEITDDAIFSMIKSDLAG